MDANECAMCYVLCLCLFLFFCDWKRSARPSTGVQSHGCQFFDVCSVRALTSVPFGLVWFGANGDLNFMDSRKITQE